MFQQFLNGIQFASNRSSNSRNWNIFPNSPFIANEIEQNNPHKQPETWKPLRKDLRKFCSRHSFVRVSAIAYECKSCKRIFGEFKFIRPRITTQALSVFCGTADRNVFVAISFFYPSLVGASRVIMQSGIVSILRGSRSEWGRATADVCDFSPGAHPASGPAPQILSERFILNCINWQLQHSCSVIVPRHLAQIPHIFSAIFICTGKNWRKTKTYQRMRALHVKHFINATDLGYVGLCGCVCVRGFFCRSHSTVSSETIKCVYVSVLCTLNESCVAY